MYFFYFDESGSRDPSVGTAEKPKDHIYVLLAVGLFEGQWWRFDRDIALVKLELADDLRKRGKGTFELADCEVKSNWLRNPKERAERSPFLSGLYDEDRERLADAFYGQLSSRKMVIMAAVIDKRKLYDYMTHEILHKKTYEFLLERIQHYMREFHPKHRALIIMDDTSVLIPKFVSLWSGVGSGFEGPEAEALDGREDVVGGLVPSERLGGLVDGLDVLGDGPLQFDG